VAILLPFHGLPAWNALGSPLTVTLTDWSVSPAPLGPLLRIDIEATDGVTTLSDRYTIRVTPVPEPSAAVLLAFCLWHRRKSRDGLRVFNVGHSP
jgi:hypothetical protein